MASTIFSYCSSSATTWVFTFNKIRTVAMSLNTETSAKVIDGKAVAKQSKYEIKIEVLNMKDAIGVVPGLDVILVGDKKDSTEEYLLNHIVDYNENPKVHGILIQLPLPRHMDEARILNAVTIDKDVDGLHPLNIGLLAKRDRDPFFVSCTPKGSIELLHIYDITIKGKRAVIIGRSNIVGLPVSLLLQREDAIITILHSRTENPEEIVRQEDIIVSAAGKANMVRGSWIKSGDVIIDVGINPIDVRPRKSSRLPVGWDVCYDEACKVASAITLVPGGVGPMTISMLLSNTLSSAKRVLKFE
ncbi:hypothetical protein C5167_005138 [Papaver somniferum]|uniref:Uncharacterized protein n=1 Tax=Papaver somniferum TaxID=3469 RepID=A0A4Y7JCW8_PAPSO|nr:hypothetical protein C5167_005138 [Papaver somniferum]